VDVAQESTALARDNIMVQAGTSMLAQANSTDQSVLKLLQG
jgi:flagellin